MKTLTLGKTERIELIELVDERGRDWLTREARVSNDDLEAAITGQRVSPRTCAALTKLLDGVEEQDDFDEDADGGEDEDEDADEGEGEDDDADEGEGEDDADDE